MKELNIAIHGSHNASICVASESSILEFIDLERYLNAKNIGLAQYLTPVEHQIVPICENISKQILKKYNRNTFDKKYASHCWDGKNLYIQNCFPSKESYNFNHHISHINGCFYQSPYTTALGISMDGGGDDGYFNVYYCHRNLGIHKLATINLDMGFAYMLFAHYLADIKYETNLLKGNLVYAGKIMGLAAYGRIVRDWIPYFEKFYKDCNQWKDFFGLVDVLSKEIGILFGQNKPRLSGQVAFDIAATSQHVFENLIIKEISPYLKQFPDIPLCLSGGCALNITLNTRLMEETGREVFVGPVPHDSGLTLGFMLSLLKPQNAFDATYFGSHLYDRDLLWTYIAETDYKVSNPNIKELAELIHQNKIIGVARETAEVGPRALGNRSILCNPMNPNMKDILNAKVKHREWYRPFAPVVRLEDVNKYFHWNKDSRWMSFGPKVREEYRNVIPSVVHVDGTARVQTVTKNQNFFIYDLLTEFEKISGAGIILNTSFNVDGKPILSSVRDAFKILNETELDCIYIEDTLIAKK